MVGTTAFLPHAPLAFQSLEPQKSPNGRSNRRSQAKLGQVAYEPDPAPLLGVPGGADWRPRHYGEEIAAAIDVAVHGLIDTAFGSAVEILTANRLLLDSAASELLAKETMSEDDLRGIASKLAPCEKPERRPALAAGGA